MTASRSPVTVEARGSVAVLRMAHGKVNALDVELCEALLQALESVARDGAGGIVLTGTGTVFSAGVDLRRVVAGGAPYLRRFLPVLRRTFTELALAERPVVAAVDGHAIAGGFVLLAAADQAVMAEGEGRIGVTELLVGVPFPAVALELVRRRSGEAQAAELVYRGLTCRAAEARSRGLVDELMAPERVVERSVELAGAMAAAGPAFTLAKRHLGEPLRAVLAGAAERDAEVDEVWQSDATLAAVRRYAEAVLGRGRGA